MRYRNRHLTSRKGAGSVDGDDLNRVRRSSTHDSYGRVLTRTLENRRHLLSTNVYRTAIARAMNQTAPVSCIPAGKMSKAKKVLDEAREIQNPELDLADKGIATFEEMPGLRESHPTLCRARARIAPN